MERSAVKNSESSKDQLIDATIALIQQSNGNIDEITIRAIAEKANVGVGLVNYHFQSKENLITICVQKMIEQTVSSFTPEKTENQSDKERMAAWAIQVFDFLFANHAISRISILGDLFHYEIDSNSIKTQRGLMQAINADMTEADKRMLSFILTSVMQTAFLSSETSLEWLGFDFALQKDRHEYIRKLVSILFEGIENVEKEG
jgi:AcrR family transcriptional regulator